jgi:hypothetical protein
MDLPLTVRYLGLFCLGGSAAVSQPVPLRLGPFHPTKSSTVEFTVTPAGTVPANALSSLNLRSAPSENGRSTLLLDLQSLSRLKFNRFGFDIYVNGPEGSQGGVPKYVIAEDATGTFCDQSAAVPFHNLTAAGDDVGSISLPLHPSYGSDCLALKLAESPLPVEVAGPSSKAITLTSNFDSLQTTVTSAEVRAECSLCWDSAPVAAVPAAPLAPQASATLTLSLQANKLHALFGKAMIMKPDKSQDQLYLTVHSIADQGGTLTSQEFPVAVRFTPPWWLLVICVLVGAGFGAWLGCMIVPAAGPFLSKATAVSLIIAVIVYLFALIAFFETDTRMVIGGFSLDPSQIIPAFLLAVLMAGGTPVLNRIRQVWGNGPNPQNPQNPQNDQNPNPQNEQNPQQNQQNGENGQ